MSDCQNRLGPFEYSTIMRPISLNLKLRNFLFSLFSFTDLMLLMLLMLEIASTVSIILKFKIRSLSFKWNWLNKRGKIPTQNRKLIKITSKQCWVRLYCHIFLENLSMHSVRQRAPKSLLQCDWWLTYSTSLIKAKSLLFGQFLCHKVNIWPWLLVTAWKLKWCQQLLHPLHRNLGDKNLINLGCKSHFGDHETLFTKGFLPG